MRGETVRVGRRRSTTQDHITDVALDLFVSRGFDEVSVDDVAQAAGIARRTLFRYYPSKNAIPWGDFDAHLDLMRHLLAEVPHDVPVGSALRSVLLAFNDFGEIELFKHRQRMQVILGTAALQAHSMTMYAGWRAVVAEFVARRTGDEPAGLIPQTTAWTMLGVALSAYEHWLADETVALDAALNDAYDTVSTGLAHL
ncbi:mycofactocin system transcriptional regulator [Mycolicibacterium sp. CAU 1645]|uniref:Mycofactocin system transcriptional regulator n=1 Tax=Mycolicibacterium arenosum TaxID=2952157 RepID=A0ABT1MAV5_9MYCO|nr:mycofactocin system transcriptional regulator [Mycolicibacterium sp. CAU 1645]MCP9275369.1 mycofactocin system transcriptional regulator [Mycolicibacterium sp. CAU 1645]